METPETDASSVPEPPVEEAQKPFTDAESAEDEQAPSAEPAIVVEAEETATAKPEAPASLEADEEPATDVSEVAQPAPSQEQDGGLGDNIPPPVLDEIPEPEEIVARPASDPTILEGASTIADAPATDADTQAEAAPEPVPTQESPESHADASPEDNVAIEAVVAPVHEEIPQQDEQVARPISEAASPEVDVPVADAELTADAVEPEASESHSEPLEASVAGEEPSITADELSASIPEEEEAVPAAAAEVAPADVQEQEQKVQASVEGEEPAVEGSELSAHLSAIGTTSADEDAPLVDATEDAMVVPVSTDVTDSDPTLVEAALADIQEAPTEATIEAEAQAVEAPLSEVEVLPSTEETVPLVLSELATVSTPSVDLGAPTPDAVETDVTAMGTDTVVETGEDEGGHPQELLVQVMQTHEEAAEDVDTDVAAPVNVSTTPSIEISDDSGAASVSQELAAEKEIERPKSPWTPSYSVRSQGPGTPQEEMNEDALIDAPVAQLKVCTPFCHFARELLLMSASFSARHHRRL